MISNPIQTAQLRFLHLVPPVKCSVKLTSGYSTLVHSRILIRCYKEPCRSVFPAFHKPGDASMQCPLVVPLYIQRALKELQCDGALSYSKHDLQV